MHTSRKKHFGIRCGGVLVSIVLCIGSPVCAGVGTSAFDSLNIEMGARAIAMGGAYVAAANDPTALYWNPACLALSENTMVSVSYNKWFEDIYQNMFAISSRRYKGSYNIGAAMSYLSVPSFDAYSVHDEQIGQTQAYDLATMVGMSWTYDKFSVGAGYKYLKQKLDVTTVDTYSIDTGLLLSLMRNRLHCGFTAQNMISGHVRFYQRSFDIAQVYKAGATYALYDNTLLLSAQQDYSEAYTTLHAGCELTVYSLLALRVGYSSCSSTLLGTGLTGGFGLKAGGMSVDYAMKHSTVFNDVHIISLSIAFANPMQKLKQKTFKENMKKEMRDQRFSIKMQKQKNDTH